MTYTSDFDSYLVPPDDLKEMGFTSLEVEAQRKKINSLSSDEFISWSKKVAAERSAQLSAVRELGTLEKVMPQALNPCYGIQQSNGAVSRYCAFGTTSVNISSVRFVSPGNSMGRVFWHVQGGGLAEYYYTPWRSGTDAWFEMQPRTYYSDKFWPIVLQIQRSPLGAVPQGVNPVEK